MSDGADGITVSQDHSKYHSKYHSISISIGACHGLGESRNRDGRAGVRARVRLSQVGAGLEIGVAGGVCGAAACGCHGTLADGSRCAVRGVRWGAVRVVRCQAGWARSYRGKDVYN